MRKDIVWRMREVSADEVTDCSGLEVGIGNCVLSSYICFSIIACIFNLPPSSFTRLPSWVWVSYSKTRVAFTPSPFWVLVGGVDFASPYREKNIGIDRMWRWWCAWRREDNYFSVVVIIY